MVKIIVDNVKSRITGKLSENVHLQIDSYLSYEHPDAFHIQTVKKGRWDGVYHLYHPEKGQSFYTGLLSIVVAILRQNNIQYTVKDVRKRPVQNLPNLSFNPPDGWQDRDYQAVTVNQSCNVTRGIIKMATGGGKTMTVARIIAELKTYPFIFYVLTRDLLYQAYHVLSSTLNEPIGIIGDGKCDIQKINVCTIQTAIKTLHHNDKKFKISDYLFDEEDKWDEGGVEDYEKISAIQDLIGKTKGIYLDECHHAAAQTVTEVLCHSPNAYWRFGGSATPYREDNAELVVQGMFGKKIVDINASYLIDNGYLIEPYIIFEKVKHDVNYHSYQKIYKNCVNDNEEFNRRVARTAAHNRKRDMSTLILVKHYNQGEMLKSFLPGVEFVTGKMSSKKREQAIADLRDKKTNCLIATTLADEGLDIPTLDAALLAGGGASATRLYQRVGRTLRRDYTASTYRDKSIVVIYDHDVKMLKKHASKARKILKMEPRFNLVKSRGPEYICGQIDEIMGTGDSPTNLFDAIS